MSTLPKIERDVKADVKAYVDKIKSDYVESLQKIDEMQYDADQIAYLTGLINQKVMKRKTHKHGWWIFGWKSYEYVNEQKYSEEYIKEKGWRTQQAVHERELQENADWLSAHNIDVSSYVTQINSLLDQMHTLGTDKKISNAQFKSDIDLLKGYVNLLIEAVRAEDAVQQNKKIVDAYIQNGILDDPELTKALQEMTKYSSIEQSITGRIVVLARENFLEYNKIQKKAKADLNDIRWYDKVNWGWLALGPFWMMLYGSNAETYKKESEYESIIHNSEIIKGTSLDLVIGLMSTMTEISPEFTQIKAMFELLEKKLQGILMDDTLSPEAKKQAAMSLFVFAMGLLNLVLQYYSKDKADSDKEMSESAADASKLAQQDTQMQMKEFKDNQEYAKNMEIIMNVSSGVLGGVMSLMAPGVIAMVIGIVMSVLMASGLLSMATEALAKEMGSEIGAEATIAGIEMVLTLGGSAVKKAAMEVAMEAAMKSIMVSLEQGFKQGLQATVEVAVRESIEALEKQGVKIVTQEMRDRITTQVREQLMEVGRKSAKEAAEKMFIQYFEQSGIQLADQLKDAALKSGLSKMIATATEKSMLEAAEKGFEIGVKQASTEASSIMVMYGRVGAAGFTAEQLDTLSKISAKASNQAVADMTGSTAEKVAKNIEELNAGRTLPTATFWYAVTSNNLLLDLVKMILEKSGLDKDSEAYKWIVMTIQIIQSLMASLSLAGAMGVGSQITMNGSNTSLLKAINFLQLFPLGATTVANYGKYQADQAQANLAVPMAETKMIQEILHFIQTNILKRQREEIESDARQNAQGAKTTSQLPEYLNGNADAISQVLAAASA